MACKYCGRDAKGRIDVYGEDECESCAKFFDAHPTPPGVTAKTHEQVSPGIYKKKDKKKK